MPQAPFIHDGDVIDFTPEANTAAGTVVVQGDLVGVTKRDIKANELGALAVTGVFDLAKPAGSGVTFAAGAKVYFDDAADFAAATDGDGANRFVGKAVKPAADADTTVRVRLSQ